MSAATPHGAIPRLARDNGRHALARPSSLPEQRMVGEGGLLAATTSRGAILRLTRDSGRRAPASDRA